MKGIYLLCLFNLMVTEAVTAANSRHTYLLKGYPKEQTDCLSLASKLGERFQQATGFQVDLALCKAESSDSFDIQIEYFSENPVPVVSTWPRTGGTYQRGRFTSRKDCESRLAGESEEFQRQTGLFPTFAYCYNSARTKTFVSGTNLEKSWGPRIEGFGKSVIQYFVSGFQLFALPKDPKSAQLRAKIDEGLKNKSAKFIDLVVQSHGPYADVVTHYYAENEITFNFYDSLRTSTEAECEAQRPDLEALFKASSNPPVVSFCGVPMVASSWEHDLLFLNPMPYRKLETFEKFKTFSECRASLATLVAKYAAQTKKDIKGGACTYEWDEKINRAVLFLN